jgi:S-adenosylmethionine/arginine decarboxylase-like enzyme
MSDLVLEINMKVLIGPFAKYVEAVGNRGLTGAVVIETSHIAMHIWDEELPAKIQFDLYTCGELPVKKVLDSLEVHLGVFNYTHLVLNRVDGFVIEDFTKANKPPIDLV